MALTTNKRVLLARFDRETLAGFVQTPAGFGPESIELLTPEGIETALAQDLPKEEKALILAVQPQTAAAIFGAKPTAAAWHHKPTWYIVSSNDRMIAPEQEKSMAKQMNATTIVLPSSHVAMLSHPIIEIGRAHV